MTLVNGVGRLDLMVRSLFAAVVAVCALSALPASAREDEWVLLGEQRVQFPGDRDVIRLSRRDGRFSAIALRVRGGDIRVFGIRVTYGNGEREEVSYGETIRDGDRSRPMDLRGEGRFIQEIEMTYGAPPMALLRQPEVQVYGRVAEDRGRDRGEDRGRGRADDGDRDRGDRVGGRGDDESFFNREGKRAACDTYAKIAAIQAQAAEKYRCRLRGPEWGDNEREHFHWCLRAPRERLQQEVRNRYQALAKCFESLGDEDYDAWRGGRR
jgi:hypothetical protein